ncbi:glycosyltransferase family 2 protein [Candidatus Bathyarchaeota archaeon]|nr:glycosyltransferase family 2 protein [Candidatus Bathyarchaeota archaeon]
MSMDRERIDVVMITRNSEKPLLDMCLKSIYNNIPVNRLIAIDGYSTDNTVRILESYPRVSVIRMKGSRGAARQRGIEEVETDQFAFVDSDVVLCKDWYAKIRPHLTERVGAVWGAAIPVAPSDLKRCTAIARFYGRSLADTMLIEGGRRGMLHDTLIRTEPVKGLRIPPHLHVWEDHYIKQHILNKGFGWVATREACCHHYADIGARDISGLIEFGRIARAHRYYDWKRILMFALLGLPKAVWIYAITRDVKLSVWQLDAYMMIITGWLADGVRPQTKS